MQFSIQTIFLWTIIHEHYLFARNFLFYFLFFHLYKNLSFVIILLLLYSLQVHKNVSVSADDEILGLLQHFLQQEF